MTSNEMQKTVKVTLDLEKRVQAEAKKDLRCWSAEATVLIEEALQARKGK